MTDKAKTGEGGAKKGIFTHLAENDAWRKAAIVVGLAGIGLILLSSLFSGWGGNNKAAQADAKPEGAAVDYAQKTQASLTELISNIEGAGEVKVLVTLEKDAEQVYATEEKTSTRTDGQSNNDNDTQTNYILVKDADGSQRALKVTEVQPVVKGVVVVCAGGGNPGVQQSITDAVTTALNISSVRVCVIKSKT